MFCPIIYYGTQHVLNQHKCHIDLHKNVHFTHDRKAMHVSPHQTSLSSVIV